MRLPQLANPVQRMPSPLPTVRDGVSTAVTPQGGTAVANRGWQQVPPPGRGNAQCACVRKGNLWVPTQNNCGMLAVPQCTDNGQCNCVHKNEQQNSGTAGDAAGMNRVLNRMGLGPGW